MAEQTELVSMIDAALERFGSRDLVSGAEVLDFLLDLRLAIPVAPGLARAAARGREPAHRLAGLAEERRGRARSSSSGFSNGSQCAAPSITSRRAPGISAANVSA